MSIARSCDQCGELIPGGLENGYVTIDVHLDRGGFLRAFKAKEYKPLYENLHLDLHVECFESAYPMLKQSE